MGKSQPKRRTTTNRGHQANKSSSAKKRNINWVRILLIIIGILIVASMVLSMFIVPGSSSVF
ncbi:hypothetical protein [Promineifilum sp.]|uniref:hypothetical protein n=1 Tax=Promineifilum sp. TaxID=2664178 RepID=UPI0035AD9196